MAPVGGRKKSTRSSKKSPIKVKTFKPKQKVKPKEIKAKEDTPIAIKQKDATIGTGSSQVLIQVLDGGAQGGTTINLLSGDGTIMEALGDEANQVIVGDATVMESAGGLEGDGIVISTADDGNVLAPDLINTNTAGLSREQIQDVQEPVPSMDENAYIIQGQDDYKIQLLQAVMDKDSMERWADLAVFCRDGMAWSSKLILSAVSPIVRMALVGMGESQAIDGTCVVLPDVTLEGFNTFQKSLFASMTKAELDLVTVIRVAEILGVDLPITADAPSETQTEAYQIDYKNLKANSHNWRRLLQSLGYEQSGYGQPVGISKQRHGVTHINQPKNSGSLNTIFQLSQILETNVTCEICQRNFVDMDSLKKHESMLHRGTARHHLESLDYSCKSCMRKFKFAVNLKKHVWLQHRTTHREAIREKLAQLNAQSVDGVAIQGVEGLAIDSKAELKKRELMEKLEDMKCSLCGFAGKNWKHLQTHLMNHSTARPHTCKECGKGFKEAQKLERHMLTHTKIKKHTCKYCGKKFGLSYNMKTHMRIHEGTGMACDFCGKVFSQAFALKIHEKKHTQYRHLRTNDEHIRRRQAFKDKRGRPSIAEKFLTSDATVELDKSPVDNQKEKENVEEEPSINIFEKAVSEETVGTAE